VRYDNGDKDALDDIELSVGAGEFIVLIGPSGCGKSTLLRTVNRLIPLLRGEIAIDGKNVGESDPVALRRTIGYAIQAVGLFAHMTVAQNIGVVPSLLGWTRDEIAARVDELLALVGLDPKRYRDRRPRDLSGGEAQRVGVARAIAARPSILLMDEPFGAVDAIVRKRLQDEMLRIVRELGTTTLFVTHDVDEALRLADRIVVMREGKIEQVGTPLDILAHPASEYVKELTAPGEAVARLRERALAENP
jgi:osmoprotectant transport system ATP-binding protein